MRIQTKKDKEIIDQFLKERILPNKENLIELNLFISKLRVNKVQKAELMKKINMALIVNASTEGFLEAMKEMI
jgi:hypothetical protein